MAPMRASSFKEGNKYVLLWLFWGVHVEFAVGAPLVVVSRSYVVVSVEPIFREMRRLYDPGPLF